MKTNTQKLVLSALLAALVCVATMIVKIPSPFKGYFNLGDGIVLLCAWLLPPWYGFAAAGLGSALADVFAGYTVYTPATFIIKGAMALIAYGVFRMSSKRIPRLPSRLVGGVLAELVMIGGYFLFEGLLYGFAPSAVNIPVNAVQGGAGLIVGVLLTVWCEKRHFIIQGKA